MQAHNATVLAREGEFEKSAGLQEYRGAAGNRSLATLSVLDFAP